MKKLSKIVLIKAKIKSTSPVAIGSGDENELLIEDSKMLLPATTITGAFRAFLKTQNISDEIIFGKQEEKSNITVDDCTLDILGVIVRAGIKIDRKKGSTEAGAKFSRKFVSKGASGELAFEISGEDIELKRDSIIKCLKGIEEGFIRFGFYKSLGGGKFTVESLEEAKLDLSDAKDLASYIGLEKIKYSDMISHMRDSENLSNSVIYNLKGKLTTPLLIMSEYDDFNIELADDTSIKEDGKYIIPGSSIKGLIRSRVHELANYKNIDKSIIDEVFGESDNEGVGLSKIIVDDSQIDTENRELPVYHRIRVDRFTSGVMETALMSDIPVQGETEFKLIYRKSSDSDIDNKVNALIIMALRDLATERLALGSGEAIGRGRFAGDILEIKDSSDSVKIDFKEMKIDNKEYVDDMMKYLNKEEA